MMGFAALSPSYALGGAAEKFSRFWLSLKYRIGKNLIFSSSGNYRLAHIFCFGICGGQDLCQRTKSCSLKRIRFLLLRSCDSMSQID